MNGLKQLNDDHDYDTGDRAIHVYLSTIADMLPDGATGYRGDGGDEVFVVARGISGADLATALRDALTSLGSERVEGVALSATFGVTSTMRPDSNADDLRRSAEATQKRAKGSSKGKTPRPSTFAVDDGDVVLVTPRP